MSSISSSNLPFDKVWDVVSQYRQGMISKESLKSALSQEGSFEAEKIDKMILEVSHRIQFDLKNNLVAATLLDDMMECFGNESTLSKCPENERYYAILHVLLKRYYRSCADEMSVKEFEEMFYQSFFKQYGIDSSTEAGQTTILELAKRDPSLELLRFVPGEKVPLELLKKIQNKKVSIYFIQEIASWPLSREVKLELVKSALESNPQDAAMVIHTLNLTETDLKELTQKGAYFQKILSPYLKDEEGRFEEAMNAASVFPLQVVEFFRSYNITNPEQLKQIILKAADNLPTRSASDTISIFISAVDNLQFSREDKLKMVKKVLEKTDDVYDEEFFKVISQFLSLDPDNEKDRVELAEMFVYQKSFSENFSLFNIEEEKSRFDLALLAASKQPLAVVQFIKSYKISDPQMKLIALKAAENFPPLPQPGTIALFFQAVDSLKFSHEDKLQLVKKALANITRVSYDEVFKEVSQFLNLDLENEKDRFELAQMCVFHYVFAENFSQFRIIDEESRFELAMQAAARNPFTVADLIQNFQISDPEKLKLIALEAAENGDISKYIENFGIKDPSCLFVIAKLCLLAHNTKAYSYLPSFKLNDAQLFSLVRLAIEAEPDALMCLENFRVTDPTIIKELFLIAAKKHPGVFYNVPLDKFPFELEDMKEFYFESVFHTPSMASEWQRFKLPEEFKFFEHPFFSSTYGKHNASYSDLLSKLSLEEPFPIKDEYMFEQAKKILFLASHLYLLNPKKKVIPQFQEICDVRDPLIRKELVKALENKILKLKEKDSLIESLWVDWEGSPPDIPKQWMKDASFKKALIQAMLTLDGNASLTSLEKMSLLRESLSIKKGTGKDKNLAMRMLKGIVGISRLGGSLKGVTPNNFNQVYQSLITQVIPMGELENFAEKYEETVQTFRDPDAVLTYASSLKNLGDYERDGHLNLYAEALEQILNKNFKQWRYEGSSHLEYLFKTNPFLKEEWMKGHREELADGKTIIDTDDPFDLLMCGTEIQGSCQHILGNSQKNKCLLTYLVDGKNRMIEIKNKKDVIQARAIFRILWDGEHPVVFLEQVYGNQDMKGAILSFAKKRAQALQIPLTTTMDIGSHASSYNKSLLSFGGRGFHEYVDANRGIFKNSRWEIKNSQLAI